MPRASSSPPQEIPEGVPAPGETVDGKYEIRKIIGVGGMGVVAEAVHTGLQERVAIKFLRPEALESQDAEARFLREARACSKLRSEHVVRVHDVGKLPFAVGCNAILGNRSDTRIEVRDGGTAVDVLVVTDVVYVQGDGGCGVGQKECFGTCVSNSDPRLGCAAGQCAPCALEHASVNVCVSSGTASVCSVQECEEGWGNCNDNLEDGCEADLTRSASCGDCGNTCPADAHLCQPATDAGGGYECVASCAPPTKECGDAGQCVDTRSSVLNCGSCGNACEAPPLATPSCSDGGCAWECVVGAHPCPPGQPSSCALDIDPANCGSTCMNCNVGTGSRPPHTVAACVDGGCATACASGYADCDGTGTGSDGDGCECAGFCQELENTKICVSLN
jgi:hypothetical protein